LFYCYCRTIGHLSFSFSIVISIERKSYSSTSSKVGTIFVAIVYLHNSLEDNGCTSSKEEYRISHVPIEESIDSTREQVIE